MCRTVGRSSLLDSGQFAADSINTEQASVQQRSRSVSAFDTKLGTVFVHALGSSHHRGGEELNAKCGLYSSNDTVCLTLKELSALHLEWKNCMSKMIDCNTLDRIVSKKSIIRRYLLSHTR